MPVEIVCAESLTQLAGVSGKVLVAGSHGGRIAAYLGASSGARALILNDAGVGKDAAGIAGLRDLQSIGMAAATVSHVSARIGDGRDALERGVISHANALAAALGVVAGQACREAAERLRRAPKPHSQPAAYADGRARLEPGSPEVWGLDSIGKLLPEDRGRVLVIGSHAALHGGRPESALPSDAVAAVFNDAGFGAAGATRLPVLDARGMPAATVDCMTARIGDARSMWETGVLSDANGCARRFGGQPGQTLRAFLLLLRSTHAIS